MGERRDEYDERGARKSEFYTDPVRSPKCSIVALPVLFLPRLCGYVRARRSVAFVAFGEKRRRHPSNPLFPRR